MGKSKCNSLLVLTAGEKTQICLFTFIRIPLHATKLSINIIHVVFFWRSLNSTVLKNWGICRKLWGLHFNVTDFAKTFLHALKHN